MENNEQNVTETLENAINQGLQEAQTIVEDTREKVNNASVGITGINVLSEITQSNIAKPLTHTIHIITSKLEKHLEIAEITLEYINTDDSITIVGKVA